MKGNPGPTFPGGNGMGIIDMWVYALDEAIIQFNSMIDQAFLGGDLVSLLNLIIAPLLIPINALIYFFNYLSF
jgi:hypothetical protein